MNNKKTKNDKNASTAGNFTLVIMGKEIIRINGKFTLSAGMVAVIAAMIIELGF